VLLHVGTNDAALAYDLPHADDRLVHLIRTIRVAAP
jgi:hypothetical protein